MSAGIETTRPVLSIHRVRESRLSKARLRSLMEQGSGAKEGTKIDIAEEKLRKAIRDFLEICPHGERLNAIVKSEL